MARLALTPQIAGYNGVTLNYQAMTGFTGVQWSNSGREILLVNLGATATTGTENIGVSILGQAVTPLSETPSISMITPYGPFPSVFNQPSSGTNQIWIDFSSVVTLTVALLQIPGVS
ncbi:MAG: hypothetical protein ACRDRN_20655 [Sciscionella sp.]